MEITDVEFKFLTESPDPSLVMQVTAHGGEFLEEAVPLQAKVGDQSIDGLTAIFDGPGIFGFLAAEPAIGDELFVGYVDEEMFPTGFTYQPANA